MTSTHPIACLTRSDGEASACYHSFYWIKISSDGSVDVMSRVPTKRADADSVEQGLQIFISDVHDSGLLRTESCGNFVVTTSNGSRFYAFWRGLHSRIFVAVSRFPHFSLSRQLTGLLRSEQTGSISALLLTLCETPILPICGIQYVLALNSGSATLEFNSSEQVTDSDVSMIPLSVLSPEMLVTAWESVILERKVLLISEHSMIISPCCEFLRRLILPLNLVNTFVPLLPRQLIHAIEAPFPYLCGAVMSSVMESGIDLSNIVLINLDTRSITMPQISGENPDVSTPRLLRARIVQEINDIKMKPFVEFLKRPLTRFDTDHSDEGQAYSQPHTAQSHTDQTDEVIQVFVKATLSLLTARDCTVSAFFRRTLLHERGIPCPEITRTLEMVKAPYGFDVRTGVAYGCLQLLREVENDSTLHFSTCWVEFDDLSMAVYEHADQLPLFFTSAGDIKSVQPAAIEPEGHVFEVQVSHIATRTYRFLATDTASRTSWIAFIECRRWKEKVVEPVAVMSAFSRFASSRGSMGSMGSSKNASAVTSPRRNRSNSARDTDTEGERHVEVHPRGVGSERGSTLSPSNTPHLSRAPSSSGTWAGGSAKYAPDSQRNRSPKVAERGIVPQRAHSISFLVPPRSSDRRYSLRANPLIRVDVDSNENIASGKSDSSHHYNNNYNGNTNDDNNNVGNKNNNGNNNYNNDYDDNTRNINNNRNSSKNTTIDSDDSFSLSLFRSCIMGTQMVAFMETHMRAEGFDTILSYLRSCDAPNSPVMTSYPPFPASVSMSCNADPPLEVFYPFLYHEPRHPSSSSARENKESEEGKSHPDQGRERRRRGDVSASVNFFLNSTIGGFLWQGGTALGLMDRIQSEDKEHSELSRVIDMLKEGALLSEIEDQKESRKFDTTPTDSSAEHSPEDSDDDQSTVLDNPSPEHIRRGNGLQKDLSPSAKEGIDNYFAFIINAKRGKGAVESSHELKEGEDNDPSDPSDTLDIGDKGTDVGDRGGRGADTGGVGDIGVVRTDGDRNTNTPTTPNNGYTANYIKNVNRINNVNTVNSLNTTTTENTTVNSVSNLSKQSRGFELNMDKGEEGDEGEEGVNLTPRSSVCGSAPPSPAHKFIEGFLRIDTVFYTKKPGMSFHCDSEDDPRSLEPLPPSSILSRLNKNSRLADKSTHRWVVMSEGEERLLKANVASSLLQCEEAVNKLVVEDRMHLMSNILLTQQTQPPPNNMKSHQIVIPIGACALSAKSIRFQRKNKVNKSLNRSYDNNGNSSYSIYDEAVINNDDSNEGHWFDHIWSSMAEDDDDTDDDYDYYGKDRSCNTSVCSNSYHDLSYQAKEDASTRGVAADFASGDTADTVVPPDRHPLMRTPTPATLSPMSSFWSSPFVDPDKSSPGQSTQGGSVLGGSVFGGSVVGGSVQGSTYGGSIHGGSIQGSARKKKALTILDNDNPLQNRVKERLLADLEAQLEAVGGDGSRVHLAPVMQIMVGRLYDRSGDFESAIRHYSMGKFVSQHRIMACISKMYLAMASDAKEGSSFLDVSLFLKWAQGMSPSVGLQAFRLIAEVLLEEEAPMSGVNSGVNSRGGDSPISSTKGAEEQEGAEGRGNRNSMDPGSLMSAWRRDLARVGDSKAPHPQPAVLNDAMVIDGTDETPVSFSVEVLSELIDILQSAFGPALEYMMTLIPPEEDYPLYSQYTQSPSDGNNERDGINDRIERKKKNSPSFSNFFSKAVSPLSPTLIRESREHIASFSSNSSSSSSGGSTSSFWYGGKGGKDSDGDTINLKHERNSNNGGNSNNNRISNNDSNSDSYNDSNTINTISSNGTSSEDPEAIGRLKLRDFIDSNNPRNTLPSTPNRNSNNINNNNSNNSNISNNNGIDSSPLSLEDPSHPDSSHQSSSSSSDCLTIDLSTSKTANVFLNIISSSAFRCFEVKICQLQKMDLSSLDDNSLFVFFCNIYNTLYVHAMIVRSLTTKRGPSPLPSSSDRQAFLRAAKYNIGGMFFSLFDIEYSVIRASSEKPRELATFFSASTSFTKSDPRKVFALTTPMPYASFLLCTTFPSTPRLQVILPGNVEQELFKCARAYILENVKYDTQLSTIHLPSILQIYSKDFCSTRLDIVHTVLLLSEGQMAGDIKHIVNSKKMRVTFGTMQWKPVIII